MIRAALLIAWMIAELMAPVRRPAGLQTVAWDGLIANGVRVPMGRPYRVQVTAGRQTWYFDVEPKSD